MSQRDLTVPIAHERILIVRFSSQSPRIYQEDVEDDINADANLKEQLDTPAPSALRSG